MLVLLTLFILFCRFPPLGLPNSVVLLESRISPVILGRAGSSTQKALDYSASLSVLRHLHCSQQMSYISGTFMTLGTCVQDRFKCPSIVLSIELERSAWETLESVLNPLCLPHKQVSTFEKPKPLLAFHSFSACWDTSPLIASIAFAY